MLPATNTSFPSQISLSLEKDSPVQQSINEFPEIKTLTGLPRNRLSQNDILDTNRLDNPLPLSRHSSECRPDFFRVPKKNIPSVQHWNKIGSVINAISKFQTTEVTPIHDQLSLQESFRNTDSNSKFPTSLKEDDKTKQHASDPPTKKAINNFRGIEKFFLLISRSAPEDLELIRKKIEEDPKRYMHAEFSPERLVNAKFMGQTPIYVACKNGHLNTLKLLLSSHADATILSDPSDGEHESPLEVAARWNHEAIVECLLKEVKWPAKQIQRALKQTTSKKLRALLKKKMPAKCCF